MSLPPVYRPKRSRLYDEHFIRRMRNNEGDWHLVEEDREYRPSYGFAKKRIEGLQVATRKNESGRFDVYARVVL